jgi:hypothetical protein
MEERDLKLNFFKLLIQKSLFKVVLGKLLNKVDFIDQNIIKNFDFHLFNRIKCY